MKHSKSSVQRKAHAIPDLRFERQKLISFSGLFLFQLLKDGSEVVFDEAGRMTEARDRHGNAVHYAYNADETLGTITEEVAGDPRLVTRLHYVGGKVDRITDPAGRVTQLTVDGSGDLVSILDPDGGEREFVYDTVTYPHRMIEQRSARGYASDYFYEGEHGRFWKSVRTWGDPTDERPWTAC